MSEALLFAEHGENMLCTKIVLNVRNNFCLSLEFSCIKLVIQKTICRHIVGYVVDAKIRASDKYLPIISEHEVNDSNNSAWDFMNANAVFRPLDS